MTNFGATDDSYVTALPRQPSTGTAVTHRHRRNWPCEMPDSDLSKRRRTATTCPSYPDLQSDKPDAVALRLERMIADEAGHERRDGMTQADGIVRRAGFARRLAVEAGRFLPGRASQR